MKITFKPTDITTAHCLACYVGFTVHLSNGERHLYLIGMNNVIIDLSDINDFHYCSYPRYTTIEQFLVDTYNDSEVLTDDDKIIIDLYDSREQLRKHIVKDLKLK